MSKVVCFQVYFPPWHIVTYIYRPSDVMAEYNSEMHHNFTSTHEDECSHLNLANQYNIIILFVLAAS